MAAVVRTHVYSSPEYKVYDPSAADVNLITDRPGYNDASSEEYCCRAIYFDTAGDIVVRLNDYDTQASPAEGPADGTAVTISVQAGVTLNIQAVAIESTGSTVTDCLVMW